MRARPSVEQLESRLVPTVPVLHSLPGAPAAVLLDFDGHYDPSYGDPSRTIPPFDFEGGPGTFTPAEQAVMAEVWKIVAEDMSPFNIDVTTAEPAPGTPMTRAAIGGNGSGWPALSGTATALFPNGHAVSFPRGLSLAGPIAGRAVHEIGHTFFLGHQAHFPFLPACTRVEFYSGPGDYYSPIMGGGTSATVATWWFDQLPYVGSDCVGGAVTHQEDMGRIASWVQTQGGVAQPWRPDEHGDFVTAPTQLADLGGGVQAAYGVVGRTFDQDWFRFTVPPQGALLAVYGEPNANPNVDLYGVLTDDAGSILAEGDDPEQTGFATGLPPGTYRLGVRSEAYGRQGQFYVVVQAQGRSAPPEGSRGPGIPVLNSLPGAQFTVYLDFNGHTQPSFGGRVMPAFDFAGGPGTYTAAEQEAIRRIWEEVAEDYSPFNINVTTVEPLSTLYNVRTVFGGTSSGWCSGCLGLAWQTIVPGTSEGLALIFSGTFGSFTDTLSYYGLHESGHAWSLAQHQSQWASLVPGVSCGPRDEYYSDPSGYLSPNLGGNGTVGIWWHNQIANVGTGCANGVVTQRDDMALIEQGGNLGSPGLVGYRADDHGDAWTAASLLVDLGGGLYGQAGILARPTDPDWFRLDVPAGGAILAAAPKPFANTLVLPNTDLYGVLMDSSGMVLAEGDDPNSLGVSVALPQGTYYLGLISTGYGRQGQYQVALDALAMPTDLPSVPPLSSRPGAPDTLYLDFDGHTHPGDVWYPASVTPPYDADGNPGSFSAAELETIRAVFYRVAEDYLPFNINVTTVEPPNCCADLEALRVVIGGRGEWTGVSAGGWAFTSWYTSAPNLAFVFSANLWPQLPGHAGYVGDTASHEAGHGFGLLHQSLYAGGVLVREYAPGPGDGTAPLMGSFWDSRSQWWRGPSSCPTCIQDDVATLLLPRTGITFAPDDHGDTQLTATFKGADGPGWAWNTGVIGRPDDADWFAFTTTGGPATFVAVPWGTYGNGDLRLILLDAAGVLLVDVDGPGTDARIDRTLAPGTYYLRVAGHTPAPGPGDGYDLGLYAVWWAVPGMGLPPGDGGTPPGTAELAAALPRRGGTH